MLHDAITWRHRVENYCNDQNWVLQNPLPIPKKKNTTLLTHACPFQKMNCISRVSIKKENKRDPKASSASRLSVLSGDFFFG